MIAVHNGEDAFTIAVTEVPDLIILDVMMPGQGGIETCRLLKEDRRTADIPVVLLTARSGLQDREIGLAAGAEPRLHEVDSDAERVVRLTDHLFAENGLRGNSEQYDDPRNSFLNEVLDRGRGIPITLSIVTMEVARRLGLAVRGVSFPGHFLAKLDGEPEVLLDAFFGRVLSRVECEARLRALAGPDVTLVPQLHLRAASPREILVRLLGNLKHLYSRQRDWGRTLGCCERILLLHPAAPLELRDRGLVYERLDCHAAAAADLARFLELAPDDESSAQVAARLTALRRRSLH